MSYEVDGEQYVAVSAGYGTALETTAAEYQRGTRLYETYCLVCHGIGAITGGVLPDLRKTGRLQDAQLWRRAVVDGDLASLGMPRFGRYVSPEDAELVRAYVARQAAILYAEEQAAATGTKPGRR